MELKVNGKDRELKFNMGFIRRLDEEYAVVRDGVSFGMGLQIAYPALEMRNGTTLSNVCRCAIGGVSSSKIDEALDEFAEENDGLEPLFEYVISELGKSPVTKSTVEKLVTDLEAVEA